MIQTLSFFPLWTGDETLLIRCREARKKHVQLIKDRHRFEAQIKQMQDQCSKMMMQKYGRIVDLEILETVTVNRQLEELKEKLRLLELQCAHETAKWDVRSRTIMILLLLL